MKYIQTSGNDCISSTLYSVPLRHNERCHGVYQHRVQIFLIAYFLLSIVLVGCKQISNFDSVYTRITESELAVGMDVPRPLGEPILTISGELGMTNEGNTLVMDRATIERIGVVEYQVQDPFENRPITYRGVLMRDLLELCQIPENVEHVKLTALNDYQIEIPIEELTTYPILFALQADNVYMEPDYQGPAMLVYPLDEYEFDLLTVKRRWIWQIKAIELL